MTYFDSAFWVVGDTILKGLMLRSPDGVTWSAVENIHVPPLKCITPAGDSLLPVGQEGTILQSASPSMAPWFRPWEMRRLRDGALAFTVTLPRTNLVIEASEDLKAWSLLHAISNKVGRVEMIDPGARGLEKRFYRANTN